MTSQINIAKEYFYNKDYHKALDIFLSIKDYYGAGLCSLLLKKEKNALNYWKKNKNCPACIWGLAVLSFINLKVPKKRPSFFQTRAFLEVYINLFLENGFMEWAQNLVASCDEFFQSNPEAYKFIARVLFSNGYFDVAITFCKKSLKLFYSDPEAFLILSQCYFLLGNLGDALDCVNRVNNMVDGYYPSLLFEEILREEINKKNNK